MRKLYSWLQRIFRSPKLKPALAAFFTTFLLFQYSARAQNAGTHLAYDGINDYLTFPGNLVSSLNSEFTLETWVYWKGGCPAAANTRTWQRIMDFGTDQSNYMFLVPQSDYGGGNGVMFALVVGGAVEYIQSSSPLTTNTWHHIAVTVNSSNAGQLYIDGHPSGTGYISNRPSAFGTTSQNWLGFSRFTPLYNDPYFFGDIDELRISDKVRYTESFLPANVQFQNDENTIALFHFNEGAGNTETHDVSGMVAQLGSSSSSEPSDPSWLGASILPVTMLEFAGTKTGNSVSLKWKADVKGEGGEFLIERSQDGYSFSRIGSVTISPVSGVYSFSFTDPQPGSGRNYYRLKIAEYGATPKYTSIVLVDLRGKSMYTLYPTITSSSLFIGTPNAVNLSIYSTAGLLVKKANLGASSTINVRDLPSGNYLIRVEGSPEVLRFIKK